MPEHGFEKPMSGGLCVDSRTAPMFRDCCCFSLEPRPSSSLCVDSRAVLLTTLDLTPFVYSRGLEANFGWAIVYHADQVDNCSMHSYLSSGGGKGGVGLGATAVFYGSTFRSFGMLSIHALRDFSPLRQLRLYIAHNFFSKFIHQ